MNGMGLQALVLHWGQVSIQPKVTINPRVVARANVGVRKEPATARGTAGAGITRRRC